jgi:hypothetical protein
VPLDVGVDRSVPGADETSDAVVRLDVVEWCRLASERLDPTAVMFEADGEVELVDDLFAAAPAFATL